jgi:hypothetical protein
MAAIRFKAILIRPEGVGTWTYLDIPERVSALLGQIGQIRVRGTVNSEPIRATLLAHGEGTHILVVGKQIREKIGVAAGDTVHVTLEEDAGKREIPIPVELRREIKNLPAAAAAFRKMAPSHRKAYAEWIDSAKKEETRRNRAAKAAKMILAGKSLR